MKRSAVCLIALAACGALLPASLNAAPGSSKVVNVPALPHKGNKPSPSSKKGEAFFRSGTCLECHSVANKGGCLAPPLDGIGAYRSKTYLIARITLGDKFQKNFERLHPGGELMPHPRLPLEQSSAIASYLLTLPAPKEGFKIYDHAATATAEERLTETAKATLPSDLKNIAEGRKIFSTAGCLACHSVASLGGHFAPSLDGIGKHRTRAYIERVISKAELMPVNRDDTSEYSERGNVMPPSGLTADQIQKVTDFIMTL